MLRVTAGSTSRRAVRVQRQPLEETNRNGQAPGPSPDDPRVYLPTPLERSHVGGQGQLLADEAFRLGEHPLGDPAEVVAGEPRDAESPSRPSSATRATRRRAGRKPGRS